MRLRPLLAACAVLAAALFTASPSGAAPAAPSAAGNDPVLVVPGFTTGPLIAPAYDTLVDRLRGDGYTVDMLVYPDYGLGDIRANAARLEAKVDDLLARTGAGSVDLVTHSMGGLVSRTYVKDLGGASKVDSLVMLGTPNYGTAVANIADFFGFGDCLSITACQQMAIGSDFLDDLNAGDDTIGDVSYTAITTVYDEVVIPYWSVYLANDGNLTNTSLQRECWWRSTGHLGLIYHAAVYDGVRDALRHDPVDMNCWA